MKNNLESIAKSSYQNKEIIVVNDCSTDRTEKIAKNFQKKFKNKIKKIKVLNVDFRGKARALNHGLKYIRGSLYMCLDADSALTPDALKSAVSSFRQKNLGSLSSNVKIAPKSGILNFIQRLEYLICYQMKKAETFSHTQYIVGGIGSMYRTRLIRTLGKYETDTITEDIDLSMKLIEHYGQKFLIGYNPNVIVFTQAVVNISDLLKQRFRWKYGRYQVFLKRKSLFLTTEKSQNFLLSWIYLPYALFSEIAYALEPMTIFFIGYLFVHFGDFWIILASLFTFCLYTLIQVTGATQSYSKKERFIFACLSPFAYFFMYILSYVEYVATIRGIFNFKKLIDGYRQGSAVCEWSHVARK